MLILENCTYICRRFGFRCLFEFSSVPMKYVSFAAREVGGIFEAFDESYFCGTQCSKTIYRCDIILILLFA